MKTAEDTLLFSTGFFPLLNSGAHIFGVQHVSAPQVAIAAYICAIQSAFSHVFAALGGAARSCAILYAIYHITLECSTCEGAYINVETHRPW